MHAPSLAVAVLLAFAPLSAGQLHVPGTHPTVQAAIDAAQPGATIFVHGGVHGPTTIDKPLTILGDPPPLFHTDHLPGVEVPWASPLRLVGGGGGVVTLIGVEVGGEFSTWTGPNTEGGGIWGGGFDELRIYHSEVHAPQPSSFTGMGEGEPALATTVPEILISNSELRGSLGDAYDCNGYPGPGRPAVDAPESTVVVLDSNVTGGGWYDLCFEYGCPTEGTPDGDQAGPGGPGIVAREVFVAGGTVSGGSGAGWLDGPWSSSTPKCGSAPDGPAFVADAVHSLPGPLSATGTLAPGEVWGIHWTPSSPASVALLFLTSGPSLPPVPTENGFLLLPPTPLWVEVAVGAASYSVAIGSSSSLVGFELGVQAFELGSGLTRPLLDVVRP